MEKIENKNETQKENYEIVYECKSINNKNVRGNELKILRKVEGKDYFEFGENEINLKKRFYSDMETMNKDFENLQKIKEKLEKKSPIDEKNVENNEDLEKKVENYIKLADEMNKAEIPKIGGNANTLHFTNKRK